MKFTTLLPASQNYEYHESHQIASTTGWIFFTLLNAYYGGALTMFFTSEVALPFDNVREVTDYALLSSRDRSSFLELTQTTVCTC